MYKYTGMDETVFKGKISFINYDKQYATIDYKADGKKKSINCKTGPEELLDATGTKPVKKPHHYRLGDELEFQVRLSDRGDRMIAYNVKFLYNTALEVLINKTNTENKFLGFLKIADDRFFVKELNSYLFFPLVLSKWELAPDEKMFNEAVDFRLINIGKNKNISAELVQHDYIPEFRLAMQYYKKQSVIEATVSKITPFGAYINVVGNAVQAKLPVAEDEKEQLKAGYQIKVKISYLSDSKIVIERVG